MEDYHLPICTHCYAVRVEPQRKYMMRPTCAACGEALSRKVVRTVVPVAKSNYVMVTDLTLLKGLNKYVSS